MNNENTEFISALKLKSIEKKLSKMSLNELKLWQDLLNKEIETRVLLYILGLIDKGD